MKITNDMVSNLSADEIDEISKRKQLLDTAEQDVFLIRDTYVFRMGEKWREIKTTITGRWVLHFDCVWEFIPHTMPDDPFRSNKPFEMTISRESLADFYVLCDKVRQDYSLHDEPRYLLHCYDEFQDFLQRTKKLPRYRPPHM